MKQKRIPCTVMRGGTSKACFFYEKDLPEDGAQRDQLLMRVMGNPDPRQLDGMGGATPSTSKVVSISPGGPDGADVTYTFGQVALDRPKVDYSILCGNISSAVGPFAIEEGMVKKVTEPITVVKMYNTNTKRFLLDHVPVEDGLPLYTGDYVTPGIPFKTSRINLEFLEPGGAHTGKTLPTGNLIDAVTVSDGRVFHVSLVDAGNPFVLVDAKELGLTGKESPQDFLSLPNYAQLDSVLEELRGWGCVQCGFIDDAKKSDELCPGLPKIGFFSPSEDKTKCDVVSRMISMRKMNPANMATAAICSITAANLRGSVVHRVMGLDSDASVSDLRIGHPSGVMSVSASLRDGKMVSVTLGRSARRLMDGCVYVG